jgi:ribosome-binding protein aMBF1 (putative translation factor)
MARKNPHIGGDVVAHYRKEMARDPELAAMVREELDRLELAAKVKSAREDKGLSQAELAELVGTKQPNIARLEAGRGIPRLDLLAKIARALGTHLTVSFEPLRPARQRG